MPNIKMSKHKWNIKSNAIIGTTLYRNYFMTRQRGWGVKSEGVSMPPGLSPTVFEMQTWNLKQWCGWYWSWDVCKAFHLTRSVRRIDRKGRKMVIASFWKLDIKSNITKFTNNLDQIPWDQEGGTVLRVIWKKNMVKSNKSSSTNRCKGPSI